jgi:hypothetical protein
MVTACPVIRVVSRALILRTDAAYHEPHAHAASRGKGKNMRYGGIGGLIVLIADVYAIVNILQSGKSTGDKVIWTVVVLVLPVLGFILWLFFGPRTGRS